MNRLIDAFLDEKSEEEHLALASSQASPGRYASNAGAPLSVVTEDEG